jgi:MFS family permease
MTGDVGQPSASQRSDRLDSAQGWRNVAVAFASTSVVFGVAYSFGAFFEPMAQEFGAGSAATSALFSITAFGYFTLGSVTGRLVDRIGPRPVLLAGAVALGVGLASTAYANSLWVASLTYGAGVGIAVACGYVPMVAVVGGWFERRRGAALGLAVAGIGVGTLIGAPLAAWLIARWGWRVAFLLFALGGSTVLVACGVFASAPPARPGASAVRSTSVLRSPAFAVLYVASGLLTLALFVPFVFLPTFAVEQGASPVTGAALVGVIGIASVVGRLVLGAVADRLGRVGVFQACFAVVAGSYGIWLLAGSYPALVAFAVVLGVGYGGFIALSPAVVAQLFGVQGLGGLIGILYTSAGLGALLGPPAAGWLIDATSSYTWAIAASLAVSVGAFLVLLPLGRVSAAAKTS